MHVCMCAVYNKQLKEGKYTSKCIYLYMHTCMYVRMHLFVQYVCMYVCMCVYVCILGQLEETPKILPLSNESEYGLSRKNVSTLQLFMKHTYIHLFKYTVPFL